MKTKQFTETLIDYIDGKVRRSDLMFKLTLGGGAGPGGGDGLPWNSIIGQLIQKRVAYDTTMSASPCLDPASGYWLQSGSLLDNLNIIRYRQLPATWFETSPTDLRGLSVDVASGVWYDAENSYFIFGGGESPTFTLPITNPRVDVVYVTSSGTIEIQQGTEASSPSITMPTASGVLPTWAVYLPPGASGIGYPCETYSGYLYQDLRPFMSYPPGGGGGGVGAHDILQADVHTDTVTQACNQGSLMLGNAADKWDELPIGVAGFALFSNGVTAFWGSAFPPVAGAGYAFISDGVNSWAVDQTPTWTGPHLFQDQTLDTVDPCYVIEIDYIKTAGATNAADDMAGIYSKFELDQVGGTIGKLYGAYIEAQLDNGSTGAGDDIWGIHTYVDLNGGTASQDVWGLQAEVDSAGTAVTGDIWGLDGWIDLNTGSVGGDVIGLSSWIDIAAGYTSPGSDVYGLYTYVDVNVAPAGTVYMLYLDEQDGIDYGIYQNGTADNYLGGKLGVGDTTPVTEVHARTIAGMSRMRVEYTDTTSLGAYEFYEGAVYKASLHVDGSAVAAPNVYLRSCLSIITGTGDIHLKSGSGHVGINLSIAPSYELDIADAADWTTQAIRTYSVTDNHTSRLYFMKSHHDTAGTLEETTDADRLGSIRFYGVDSDSPANWAFGARIDAIQRDAAGPVFVETDLIFETHSATALNVDQLYLDGGTGNVGVGRAPVYHFEVYDNAVSLAALYRGAWFYHAITAQTNPDQDAYGLYSRISHANAAGRMDDLYGCYVYGLFTSGEGESVFGMYLYARAQAAATLTGQIRGTYVRSQTDDGASIAQNQYGLDVVTTVAGDIGSNVYGIDVYVDANAAGDVTGDIYGVHVEVDNDLGVHGGQAYVLYLWGRSHVDYGIYQTGGDKNYFGSPVGIGHDPPAYQLEVWDDVAGKVVMIFNDGDNANRVGMHIQCGADADGGLQYFVDCRAGAGLFQGYVANNAAGNMVFIDASDKSLKEDIEDYKFDDLKQSFKNVKYRTYTKRGNPDCNGYVAQELQPWFPEAVQEMHVDGETLLGVSQMSLIGPMMEMIKQLILEVEVLQQAHI